MKKPFETEEQREVWGNGVSQHIFVNTSPMPLDRYPIKKTTEIHPDASYQNYMEIRAGKLILTHPDTKEEMTVIDPLELIRIAFTLLK